MTKNEERKVGEYLQREAKRLLTMKRKDDLEEVAARQFWEIFYLEYDYGTDYLNYYSI